jgi:hypothetical protein
MDRSAGPFLLRLYPLELCACDLYTLTFNYRFRCIYTLASQGKTFCRALEFAIINFLFWLL